MAEKRQLKNWLSGFLDWTMPRSETPESMLKWAGLFTLAAVMKRKVWWPKRLMGGYEIYPNLYIVFVGEPAVVRKSTTTGFSKYLLSKGPLQNGDHKITFAGDVTSHSKLLNGLMESDDASLAIVADEFSSLVQTTPEAMYEILTDIFDNKATLEWSTWAHGDKSVNQPVVNLIAATTPAWISGQPPEYFVGGGFASRILFLYEDAPRVREIYYDHVDQAKILRLEDSLVHDLLLISSVSGEFTHDKTSTKEHIRSWYKSQDVGSEDSRLKGYFGRKHVHAHKVAGLLSLAEGDSRKITRRHWVEAIKMLDYLETRMSSAFATLGVDPFTQLMDGLELFVKENPNTNLQRIAGRFYREGMGLEQLKSALAFLCTAGKLKMVGMVNPTYKHLGD